MNEKQDKKSVGSLIREYGIRAAFSLVPVLVGVIVFNKQQRAINAAEFKKNLWLNRLVSYQKTAESVGSIIIYVNKDERLFLQSVHDFGVLYWGELYLREEPGIAAPVNTFKDMITGLDKCVRDADSINSIVEAGKDLIKALKQSERKELNELTNE